MKRSYNQMSGAHYFTPSQLSPGTFDAITVQVEFAKGQKEEFVIEFSYDWKGMPICKIAAFNDAFNALAACADLIQAMGDLFDTETPACPFVITGFMEDHLGFIDATPMDEE